MPARIPARYRAWQRGAKNFRIQSGADPFMRLMRADAVVGEQRYTASVLRGIDPAVAVYVERRDAITLKICTWRSGPCAAAPRRPCW